MAKKKAVPAQEPVPAEPTLEVVPQEDQPQQETPAQKPVDKTHSYMVPDEKGILRRRAFKESQATEDDIMHFVRRLGTVYDEAPYLAKVNFMFHAFPVFREFMRKHDPEILAAILHEPEKAPN